MQREEGVPQGIVQELFQPLMLHGGTRAGGDQARPPRRLRPRSLGPKGILSQVVRRSRSVQLAGLFQRAELVGAPVESDIVGSAQLHGLKRQVPQRKALEVTKLAVLR